MDLWLYTLLNIKKKKKESDYQNLGLSQFSLKWKRWDDFVKKIKKKGNWQSM